MAYSIVFSSPIKNVSVTTPGNKFVMEYYGVLMNYILYFTQHQQILTHLNI